MWGRCVDAQYAGVAREKRDKGYIWTTEKWSKLNREKSEPGISIYAPKNTARM
jgi:hypothetical protein